MLLNCVYKGIKFNELLRIAVGYSIFEFDRSFSELSASVICKAFVQIPATTIHCL